MAMKAFQEGIVLHVDQVHILREKLADPSGNALLVHSIQRNNQHQEQNNIPANSGSHRGQKSCTEPNQVIVLELPSMLEMRFIREVAIQSLVHDDVDQNKGDGAQPVLAIVPGQTPDKWNAHGRDDNGHHPKKEIIRENRVSNIRRNVVDRGVRVILVFVELVKPLAQEKHISEKTHDRSPENQHVHQHEQHSINDPGDEHPAFDLVQLGNVLVLRIDHHQNPVDRDH